MHGREFELGTTELEPGASTLQVPAPATLHPHNFPPFKTLPGLSLRGTSTGCPRATMNVVPGNFQREIEEK